MQSPPSPRLLESKYVGSPHRLFFSSFCALIGAISFGFTIGYSSPAIPQMEAKGILKKELSSVFGSLLPLGGLIGSPLCGFLIDKYGRRKSLMMISIPYALGWLLILDASGVVTAMIGRMLTGVASGMITVACPVYIAEISTRTLRGTLGSCTQLAITIGILLAYLTGMHMTYTNMAGFGIFLAIISGILMLFTPETPRWYLLNDRKTEAIQSLTLLRGPHTNVQEECRDLEDGIDSTEQLGWTELIKRSQLFRPLKISIALMIFQQLSGINAVMFYAESIFKAAGFTDASKASVIIGFTQVIATTIACFLMDIAGRRILLIIAGSLMACTCFSFAWYYHSISQSVGTTPSNSWLAVASLVFYIIGFSLGWGPIPTLVMSEIFPSQARGRASSIAMMTNWSTGFVVSIAYMTLQEMISPGGTFALFGVSCLCSIFYVMKAVPETKGKSLEDIEMYFLGKSLISQKDESTEYNV